MTLIAKGYTEEMALTGAGINHEDEINMDLDNEFTNKWGKFA